MPIYANSCYTYRSAGHVNDLNQHGVHCASGSTCIIQPNRPQPALPPTAETQPIFRPAPRPDTLPSPDPTQIKCVTTCQSKGSCKVRMVNGPPGKLSGSCFPASFGGSCSGIPDQCVRGNHISSQCGNPCKAGTRYVWNPK